MSEETKNKLPFYFYLLPLVLIFLISYLALKPLFFDIREKRKEVLTKEMILVQKKKTVVKFKETAQKYQDLYAEIKKIDKIIFSEVDLPKLLFQLENLAINNGMVLGNVSFGGISSEGNVGVVSINIQLAGSYQSFKNYLDALSISIPLIDVVSVNSVGFEGDENSYSFSLDLRSYAKTQ